MTDAEFEFIVSRVVANAYDALKEAEQNKDDFYKGRKFAYYEVLNTIKNELIVREQELNKYNLDIDLEKIFY